MKHFVLRRLAVVFVGTFLVACSGGANPTLRPATDGGASARQAATGLPKGALYVGAGFGEHSRVNVYANAPTGGWTPIAKITDHIESPASMAIAKDELYVADLYANAVSIYNLAHGGIYVGSLTDDISRPIAVTADDAGDVAVVNSREEKGNLVGVVTVYPLGSPFPYVIRKGMNEPKAVAFDKSRNLYVANLGDDTVKVYAPGGDTIVKSISEGVSLPTALAFHGGLLFVANAGGYNVTGYAPNSRNLILVVPTGDLAPSALAIGDDRMYIGAFSYTHSEVIDYDFFTQHKTKITEGVRSPKGLAVCAVGEVCVQNDRNVTVYQSDKLIQTIREPASPHSIIVDR